MDFSRPSHHLGVTREENLVAVTGELGLAQSKGEYCLSGKPGWGTIGFLTGSKDTKQRIWRRCWSCKRDPCIRCSKHSSFVLLHMHGAAAILCNWLANPLESTSALARFLPSLCDWRLIWNLQDLASYLFEQSPQWPRFQQEAAGSYNETTFTFLMPVRTVMLFLLYLKCTFICRNRWSFLCVDCLELFWTWSKWALYLCCSEF